MIRWLAITAAICIGISVIIFVLCFFGVWIPNEPSKSKYPIRGVDVSHHQGRVDWNAVRASGISFAYIKATEGSDFTDGQFAENWEKTAVAGLLRGAYHFFTLDSSGEAQASHLIATVPIDDAALPPAIDLEFSGYNKNRRPTSESFRRELSIFYDALCTRYHTTPVVYTTRDFQEQYLARMPIERLWIREVLTTPRRSWLFWQFTPRGRVKGVATFVDLNVFSGSESDLRALSK
jgi:lysozyme